MEKKYNEELVENNEVVVSDECEFDFAEMFSPDCLMGDVIRTFRT